MRRYVAFAFDVYYPMGGWSDIVGTFDTIEEATEAIKSKLNCFDKQFDEFQVVDIQTGKIVLEKRK